MSRVTLLILPAFVIGVAVGVIGERKRHAPAAPQDAERPIAPPPQSHDCTAERAELNSTRVQLAICMAYDRPQSDTHAADEAGDALTPAQQLEAEEVERVRRYRQVLRENKEVVIVRRADQTVEAYPVGAPIPDGIIVARRLPSGETAWYTGTGSREDPASFRVPDPGSALARPVIERGPDGTIMVNGKPGSPAVQHMFGGAKD